MKRQPNEIFRQFGKTTMLAELAMLRLREEIEMLNKRKHRTLKDVLRQREGGR